MDCTLAGKGLKETWWTFGGAGAACFAFESLGAALRGFPSASLFCGRGCAGSWEGESSHSAATWFFFSSVPSSDVAAAPSMVAQREIFAPAEVWDSKAAGVGFKVKLCPLDAGAESPWWWLEAERSAESLLSSSTALPFGAGANKKLVDPEHVCDAELGLGLSGVAWALFWLKKSSLSSCLAVAPKERAHFAPLLLVAECASSSSMWQSMPMTLSMLPYSSSGFALLVGAAPKENCVMSASNRFGPLQ